MRKLLSAVAFMLFLAYPAHGQALFRLQNVASGGGGTAPANIQFAHNLSTASTTLVINGASPRAWASTAAGDYLGIWVCTFTGSNSASVADSSSTAWTLKLTEGACQWYERPNTAAGVTSVTATWASAASAQATAVEFSNVATATPFDKSAGQVSAGTSFTSTATTTTAQSTEVLIGLMGDPNSGATVTGLTGNFTGGTIIENYANGTGSSISTSWIHVAATGTYAFTGTLSNTDAIYAAIVTLKSN
jgi:hypothetical protein